MKIEITDKGIKPQDVFKIINKEFKYIALQSNNSYWSAFKEKPKLDVEETIFKWSIKLLDGFYAGGELLNLLKIDYSGTPEDSLFCRSDFE